MRILCKVEMIAMLKDKIEEVDSSSKDKAKKLKKLLKKLTKGPDVS